MDVLLNENPGAIDESGRALHWSDYLVIGVYFVCIIGVGLWVCLKAIETKNDFFFN